MPIPEQERQLIDRVTSSNMPRSHPEWQAYEALTIDYRDDIGNAIDELQGHVYSTNLETGIRHKNFRGPNSPGEMHIEFIAGDKPVNDYPLVIPVYKPEGDVQFAPSVRDSLTTSEKFDPDDDHDTPSEYTKRQMERNENMMRDISAKHGDMPPARDSVGRSISLARHWRPDHSRGRYSPPDLNVDMR